MHYAVGIDIKADLYLRYSARCGGYARQLEATEGLIVLRHLAFALQHMHFNACLTIRSGGEYLALLGGDGGIAVYQAGEYAADSFDTKGQRSYIKQQNVLHFAAEHTALYGRADSNAFIGVDALKGLFAGNVLNKLLYAGNTGRAADQYNLIYIGIGKACILHGNAHALAGLFDQVMDKLFELSTGDGHIKVLRTGAVCRDEGQVYVGLHHAGKLYLSLFGSFLQPLHGHTICAEIYARLALELTHNIVHQPLVEVVAAKAVIAMRSQNFEHAIADFKYGYIERAAAKVVYQNLLIGFLIHAVSKRGSGRLINYTQHVKARNAAGVLSGLALGIAEIRRDGYNGLSYLFAKVGFGVLLQLLKDHCAYLLRSIILTVDVLLISSAHLSLYGADGLIGVGDSLALCRAADYPFVALKCNHGRSGARTLSIGDNNRLAAFKNRHARICSTKVNTDDLCHNLFPPEKSQFLFIISQPSPCCGELCDF